MFRVSSDRFSEENLRSLIFRISVKIIILSLEIAEVFNPFPDELTNDRLFDGIKYQDLPFISICCAPNNTKFWLRDAKGNKLEYASPRFYGYKNAAKRSNVAGQTTGMNFGQLARNRGIKTVRVRIDGFNNARVSSIKGLLQAGLNVVSVTDCTPIDWEVKRRPKKRKRPHRM